MWENKYDPSSHLPRDLDLVVCPEDDLDHI
jgi:hypothetical protein